MSWIKVETHLLEKYEVFELSEILNISTKEAAINCIILWSWFDDNSIDGVVKAKYAKMIDKICGCDDFTAAMIEVGWILSDGENIKIPNYDRHNSKSAKNRALGAKRNAKYKQSKIDNEAF